jgi:hypothetical protein
MQPLGRQSHGLRQPSTLLHIDHQPSSLQHFGSRTDELRKLAFKLLYHTHEYLPVRTHDRARDHEVRDRMAREPHEPACEVAAEQKGEDGGRRARHQRLE